MINFRHDLKSLHCNMEAGGCGLKYTIPPEHNTKHEEMRIHRRIQHGHKPQVIDKKTKDLRDMTPEEHAVHMDGINGIVAEQLRKDQKELPHNKLTVNEEIVNGQIYHTIEMEPVYGTVESELKQLISGEGGQGIAKMVSQILIKCPKCGKVGAKVERVMEPKPKET